MLRQIMSVWTKLSEHVKVKDKQRRFRDQLLWFQFFQGGVRPRYSNSTEIFKQPKNREDCSDLDENLTETIAAMKSII